ncbi:tubulin-tyrosine ligase family protein (macronuclear) [Tetrahymena thermophila SB210]|uniref:Tubulin-tyrosine ligase family protein n=1 Tax=Tetrahymena thermophila (strain SB210) TaxID=312017 RepID=Q231M3_TETTS|nr:tubulin-tyrosine ligase family protein [Tetrahymena thermophila SB210]EAR91279.1 tubulin-tyrosine ligase family protein [Tetrahymena thermophila SB210]|eukprot:XP_001011524.1 tubulin-tyrosine ligase family protein [Tetrahymena thermophila SB210]
MRSKSTQKLNNNFYKYIRGSFGNKDYHQMYEEVIDYDTFNTKSDKSLKINPYLQSSIKQFKTIQSSDLNSNRANNLKRKVKTQKVNQTKENQQTSQVQISSQEIKQKKLIHSAEDIDLQVKQFDVNANAEAIKLEQLKKIDEAKAIQEDLENRNKQRQRDMKLEKLPLNLSNNNKKSLQNVSKRNPQLAETLDIYSQSSGIYQIMQKSLLNGQSYSNLRSNFSQSIDKKHTLPAIPQTDNSEEPLLIKLIKHQQMLEKERSSQIRQQYLQRKSELQSVKNQHTQNLKTKEKESLKIQEQLRIKIEYYKRELEKERQNKQTIHQLTDQLRILLKDQNLMNKSLLPYISVKDTLAFFSQNQIFQFYYIGKGNNSEIVRRILETRVLLQEVDEVCPEVNFEWHPFSRPIQFSKLGTKGEIQLTKKVVNHFEYHHEITTKSNLVKNMKNYCAENKLDVFEYTPITFEINVDSNSFMNEMRTFLQYYMKNLPSHLKTQKDQIEIKKRNGRVQFQLRPNENQNSLQDRKESTTAAPNFQMKESYISEGKSPYVWLLKPVNLNRGRGIEVFSSVEELEKLVNEYYIGFPEKNFKEEQEKLLEEKTQLLKLQNEAQIKSSSNLLVNKQTDLAIFASEKIPSLDQQTNSPSTDDKSDESDENKGKQTNQVKFQIEPSNQVDTPNIQATKKTIQSAKKILQPTISIQSQVKSGQFEPLINGSQINIAKSINLLPRKPQTASLANSQVIASASITRKGFHQQIKQPTVKPQKGGKFIISENQFVIQKYIERPLLINQRKFDIRVWVLVTQNMDVLIFKQGYLRMSSEVYDITDLQNPFIHLTNNAVQQHSKNYGKFENGNQMSFEDFQIFLDKTFPSKNISLKDKIIPKMEEEIKLSLQSVRNKLNMNQRPNCFEIFGYDFIIDELFNVWIIEVNTNPCIEESSPILKILLPRMLDDAFKLTIDQMLKIDLSQRAIKYPVPGYLDEDNMWKMLCTLQSRFSNSI